MGKGSENARKVFSADLLSIEIHVSNLVRPDTKDPVEKPLCSLLLLAQH